jgi:uncharacterized protein (DUF486 family)
MPSLPVVAQTTFLLTASNVFMTFAWYAHLRKRAGLCLIAAVCFMFRSA